MSQESKKPKYIQQEFEFMIGYDAANISGDTQTSNIFIKKDGVYECLTTDASNTKSQE